MNLTQEQKDAIAAAEQAKANSGKTTVEGEATFTQEQVNKMIAERLARVKPSNDLLSAADIRMLKKKNHNVKKKKVILPTKKHKRKRVENMVILRYEKLSQ